MEEVDVVLGISRVGAGGAISDPQDRTSVATEPRLDGCGCTEGEGPPVVHMYIDVCTLG